MVNSPWHSMRDEPAPQLTPNFSTAVAKRSRASVNALCAERYARQVGVQHRTVSFHPRLEHAPIAAGRDERRLKFSGPFVFGHRRRPPGSVVELATSGRLRISHLPWPPLRGQS
jgi:hypothetical protein